MFGYEDPIYQASLIFSCTFIVVVLAWSIRQVVSYAKQENELDKIEEEYDSLRSHRQDLKQHYYWARESGEHKKLDRIIEDLAELDERIERMKEKFDYVSQKKYK